MIEKAIDATMDSDLKDSKYRRDSHKVMAEWSNSIGRSISDSSNKSFGKRRGNSKENMKKRVKNSQEEEFKTAISEIHKIAKLRINDLTY